MILYRVSAKGIEVLSVVRETRCGWREKNGGFINQSRMGKYPSFRDWYYTTDFDEAKSWAVILINKLSDHLHVSRAALADVIEWKGEGTDEDNLPKPRSV